MREIKQRDGKGRFVKGHTKVGGFDRGSKHTKEIRKKVSESMVGKYGDKARRWKGDDAGYVAKHMWIIKHYGKADRCEQAGCTFGNPKRYEWHNISREYKRDRTDYVQLCPSCHRKIDMGGMELCVL
jgi:hypothetical protein